MYVQECAATGIKFNAATVPHRRRRTVASEALLQFTIYCVIGISVGIYELRDATVDHFVKWGEG